jgi:voltage-gated potassium channel
MVLLESVAGLRQRHGLLFKQCEWIFTICFTLEYGLRIVSVRDPRKYIFSFYGLIDLVAIIPTYLSLYFADIHSLFVLRALRLLRVFRIFKLARYVKEAEALLTALRKSRPKITVFIGAVFSIVLIMGTFMYLIEGEATGFSSIPRSMYWSVVTLTTVGYGDITPKTVPGQMLSSIIMILGYAIIAVPTGILSVEYASALRQDQKTVYCPVCGKSDLEATAHFCSCCGNSLADTPKEERRRQC